ncbi:hypothetical protein TW81_05105 [Vibrio galatheae]|uniref:Polysaccharide chain length determinant N-terminal domain-containing protein n=1 Tax=Vibrio galatheae TaxID=579748 RepID=A0A0F4NQ07_9VIBR|nr:GNVR domain-containing protein [Vibrio galatheae]KJY84176.1 hypothetical protein TW81_05105 [Vibrio galatheae]
MSGQNQQPVANHSYPPQIPNSFSTGDEIDLRELLKALWDGKLIIIAATFLLAIFAAGYALSTPNVYKAGSSFLIDKNFFNAMGVNEPNITSELVASQGFKHKLTQYAEVEQSVFSGVSLTLDQRTKTISISQFSTDLKFAFDGVNQVSLILNDVLKQQELNKVEITLKALQSNLADGAITPKAQDYLDELLAQQLYRKAMLENPNTELVKVIKQAVLPTSHVKPKRPLIIVLGTLLGGMLGVAIVLVRFAFRREDD